MKLPFWLAVTMLFCFAGAAVAGQSEPIIDTSATAKTAVGKALVAFNDQLPKKLYLFMKPEGKLMWDNHEEMDRLADEMTLNGGLPERNRLAYFVTELFKGKVEDFRLPRTALRDVQTTYWNVRDIPFGVKQVLFLRVYDSAFKDRSREIMVFAFEDMTFDEMRRIALEEGVARVIRIKDMEGVTRKNGLYLVGSVPNTLRVSEGTVLDVKAQEISQNGLSLGSEVGSLAGQVGGYASGLPGAAIAGLLVAVSSLVLEQSTSTVTVYQVSFKRDDAEAAEATLEAPWAADLKSGDRIKVTQGSFTTTLERASMK